MKIAIECNILILNLITLESMLEILYEGSYVRLRTPASTAPVCWCSQSHIGTCMVHQSYALLNRSKYEKRLETILHAQPEG